MVRDWSLALVAARPRTVSGDENVLLESDMAKARWYSARRAFPAPPQGVPPMAPVGASAWRPRAHFGTLLTRSLPPRELYLWPQWVRPHGVPALISARPHGAPALLSIAASCLERVGFFARLCF